MSYSNADWRMAITNLIKLTSKGEIKWDRSHLYTGDAWTDVQRSFESKINDKVYVVSSTKSKSWVDEDEFVWSQGYDFSVFDGGFDKLIIGSAPSDLNIIKSLFDVAEQSFAFERKALDGLL